MIKPRRCPNLPRPASQDRPRIRIDCQTTAETPPMQSTIHVYEVRSRKDKRGVDLVCNALPFKPGFCIRQYCHSDPAVAGEESLIKSSGNPRRKIRDVSLRST